MQIKKRKLELFSDECGGTLIPIEFKDLGFKPKRLFYVVDVPQRARRGEHAHFKTEQLLICVKGMIGVQLYDGKSLDYVTLEENEYVHVHNLVWDAQDFLTGDDVLLVLCSTNYDRSDYIEDLDHFERLVG